MVHLSIRRAVWWFIDSSSAIFCFRCSEVPWKLKTKKNGIVNYTVENLLLPGVSTKKYSFLFLWWYKTYRHTSKMTTRRSKIFVADFLSAPFTFQTHKTEQDVTSVVALSATPNDHVLSTVEVSRWSISSPVQRWQNYYIYMRDLANFVLWLNLVLYLCPAYEYYKFDVAKHVCWQ